MQTQIHYETIFDDWGWVGEGAVGIDSLDNTILDDCGWGEVDLDEVWFKAIEKKPEGAERELEEGIWASEGVEAKTGRDRSRLRMK